MRVVLVSAFAVLFFHICVCTEPPKWVVEDNRFRYDEYERCLVARKFEMDSLQGANRFRSVFALRGSVILLKCFECLDNADAAAMEDVWKPNESLLSRKLRQQVDKVKEAIRKAHSKDETEGKSKKDETRKISHYYWELLRPTDKDPSWRPPVDMHEPVNAAARVAKMMRSFLNRRRQRFAVGNHFELEFQSSNVNDTGWYRCVERTPAADKRIASGYFVDVLADYRSRMLPYDDPAVATLADPRPVDSHPDLELVYRSTAWTQCSRCGDSVVGETRRQFSCVVRTVGDRWLHDSGEDEALSVFRLVPEIPCLGALLPTSVQRVLHYDYDVIEVFRSCQIPCPLSHNETRVVQGYDEDGSPLIVDRLPPGEFAIDERLPPLRSPIRRRVIRRKTGDVVVLDCGPTMEGRGLIWHFNYAELSSSMLLADSERKLIGTHSRLIIRRLMAADQGVYTCITITNETAAIFLVYAMADIGSADQYISALQLSLRFVAVLLLMCLFVSTMRRIGKDSRGGGNKSKIGKDTKNNLIK